MAKKSKVQFVCKIAGMCRLSSWDAAQIAENGIRWSKKSNKIQQTAEREQV